MNVLNGLLGKKSGDEESWISTSDMMTGLMMIFLFVSIIYIAKVKSIVGDVENTQDKICSELVNEFAAEKKRWNMSICEDGLVVRFTNVGFFKQGLSELEPRFKKMLTDFYPRFKSILWRYEREVSELRIEGHASSEGKKGTRSRLEAYLYNTQLSQDRSYEVMKHVLNLEQVKENPQYLTWAYRHLTAHGLSSSEPISYSDGEENKGLSRRVEFRIKTKAQDKLLDIVKALDGT